MHLPASTKRCPVGSRSMTLPAANAVARSVMVLSSDIEASQYLGYAPAAPAMAPAAPAANTLPQSACKLFTFASFNSCIQVTLNFVKI
jgi:hypothetical protein